MDWVGGRESLSSCPRKATCGARRGGSATSVLSTHFLPTQQNRMEPSLCCSFSLDDRSWSPEAWGLERGEVGTELGPRAGPPAVLSSPGWNLALIPFHEDHQVSLLTHLISPPSRPTRNKSFCASASPVADLKLSEGCVGEDSFPATPITWPLSFVMTRGASFLPVPGSHGSLVY